METKFITGYSYKGGVGRSTALANIACLLAEDAEHPQKVLLWDFDLEAPGMHRLFPSNDLWRSGFVDLAYEFASSGELPDPSNYVYRSMIPGIDVLPAGLVNETYCEKLALIDWPSFFGDDPKQRGPFFDPLVTWIKEAAEYDYVLVDSRTGLSDVAGICTQVLPDVLIILFRLQEQNIDGILHLVPVIREQLATRGRDDVFVLPVVSPVPPQSSESANKLRERASDVFAEDRMNYIRFDLDLVAEERLFCLERVRLQLWPEPPVVADYQRLSKRIRDLNQHDTRTLFRKMRKSIHQNDFASARRDIPALIRRRPDLPDLWHYLRIICRTTPKGLELGDELADELEASGETNIYLLDWQAAKHAEAAISPSSEELTAATKCLQQAVETDPKRPTVYRRLAEIAECTGDLESATRSLEKLHEVASNNFQSVLDLAHLYVRRGRDYFMLAKRLLEPHSSKLQSPILVYLCSFFGDEFEAGRALEEMKQASAPRRHETHIRLVEAYSQLLLGNEGAARTVAEAARRDDEFDVRNWAEFFVCLLDFDEAVCLLDRAKEAAIGEEVWLQVEPHEPLKRLARFLQQSKLEITEEEVINDWKSALWSFTELLFFREHVLKEEKYEHPERLAVIEKLIQISSLASVKGDESIFWRRAAERRHVLFQQVGQRGRIRLEVR